jgi:hypothetical protein
MKAGPRLTKEYRSTQSVSDDRSSKSDRWTECDQQQRSACRIDPALSILSIPVGHFSTRSSRSDREPALAGYQRYSNVRYRVSGPTPRSFLAETHERLDFCQPRRV